MHFAKAFLPGSDLTSLKQRKREFYDGLIHWKSALAQTVGPARMLEVELTRHGCAVFVQPAPLVRGCGASRAKCETKHRVGTDGTALSSPVFGHSVPLQQ